MDESAKRVDAAARNIILIEGDDGVRARLVEALRGRGYTVRTLEGFESVPQILHDESVDLIVADRRITNGSGVEFLEAPSGRGLEMILTGIDPSSPGVPPVVRSGAADYVKSPAADVDDFLTRVGRSLHTLDLKRQNRGLAQQLTQRSEALVALSIRDPLTGLHNHASFHETLDREIHRCERNDLELSLLIVDVDHFGRVNDDLGHEVGDRLLRAFSEMLVQTSRSYDLVFRLRARDVAEQFGGDEFAVVMPHTPKIGGAVKAERLRKVAAMLPYGALGLPKFTLSMGVATFPDDASRRMMLVDAADHALNIAKRSGRDRLVTFSDDLTDEVDDVASRMMVGSDTLSETLGSCDFDLVYQPVQDVGNDRLFAYEALCRPNQQAFSTPARLIQAAERSGRVIELGRALRKKSLETLQHLPGDVGLLINLHPHELNDAELLEGDDRLSPWAGRIVFEITEAGCIKDVAHVRRRVAQVHGLGFRVALCDLTPGYVAIQTVAALLPDFVKLEMSVISAATDGAEVDPWLRHLIEFTSAEDVSMIAQGIETVEQRDQVQKLGINLMQGWLFGHPGPIEAE